MCHMGADVRLRLVCRIAIISQHKGGVMVRLIRWIDTCSEWMGRLVMWLTTGMMLITVYNVTERYAFGHNTTYLIELNWHFYSLIFLLGAAYTFKHDGHVRVDLLYHRMKPRAKAWVNLLGTLLFLLPFCGVVIYTSLASTRGFEFSLVGLSWRTLEGSPDPGGLPARYLLKSALPLGFFLLALQGVAEVLRNVLFLKTRDEETA